MLPDPVGRATKQSQSSAHVVGAKPKGPSPESAMAVLQRRQLVFTDCDAAFILLISV